MNRLFFRFNNLVEIDKHRSVPRFKGPTDIWQIREYCFLIRHTYLFLEKLSYFNYRFSQECKGRRKVSQRILPFFLKQGFRKNEIDKFGDFRLPPQKDIKRPSGIWITKKRAKNQNRNQVNHILSIDPYSTAKKSLTTVHKIKMDYNSFSQSPNDFFWSLLDPIRNSDQGQESTPDILECEEIFNLFPRKVSTGDFHPPLQFPMLPVPDDLFNDTQGRNYASMNLSLNDLFNKQDLHPSYCLNNPNRLGSSRAGILVEKSNDGKGDESLHIPDMDLVSKHVGKSAQQYDKESQREVDVGEHKYDMLDCMHVSFADFRNAQKHMSGVPKYDTEPKETCTFKASHVRNGSTSNQWMRCVMQTTSTPHLRLTPSIKKIERKFQCPYCELTFTRRTNCYRHVDIVHNKIKRFECPTCSMKFSTKQNMKTHQKTHFRKRTSEPTPDRIK